MKNQGLLLIYTGAGKGKTSAAFGQALRAAGQGLSVCLIQFIKARPSGELLALQNLALPLLELHQVGSGFSWQDKEKNKFREAALAGWELALGKMAAGYDLLVLDELTYLISFAVLPEKQVLEAVNARPPSQHLLITGRDASPGLIARADLVTEMREIKHPFRQGIKAQKGIEF